MQGAFQKRDTRMNHIPVIKNILTEKTTAATNGTNSTNDKNLHTIRAIRAIRGQFCHS